MKKILAVLILAGAGSAAFGQLGVNAYHGPHSGHGVKPWHYEGDVVVYDDLYDDYSYDFYGDESFVPQGCATRVVYRPCTDQTRWRVLQRPVRHPGRYVIVNGCRRYQPGYTVWTDVARRKVRKAPRYTPQAHSRPDRPERGSRHWRGR